MKELLSALLLLAALNQAAALPNFDPFADATASGGTSYAVDAGLAPNNDGANNDWQLVNSSQSGNPQPTIVAGNLSYPDLPASTGNSVSNAPSPSGTGRTARLNLHLSAAPPIVYYSFILKVTDVTAVPTVNNNNFFAGFSDTVGAQAGTLARCGGRLVARQSGSGFVLGIGKGSTVAGYAYDPTERNVGDVLFVAVSYEQAGGATNVNLWVNPPSSSFGSNAPPAPVASITSGSGAGDMNNNGISAFVLSCQTTLSPSCIIDEVRVATNWGIVTGGNPAFPVAITAQPASRRVAIGDRVAFVVGVGGTSPSYQWRFNGTDIPDATNAAHSIMSAQTTNAGSYSVVVTNVLNALTSAPAAVLTVSQTPLPLRETNLLVVRVGDGAQTLTTSGNSVFLDQFTTTGTYVNTIFIPDTGASALIEAGPDVNGATLTGAAVTRSADKRLLALSGYNVSLGNLTPLQSTTSATVPRGIVTIDSTSQVTLALAGTNAYSTAYFRGAATDGTNNFWGAGSAEGTHYFGLNSPAALVQTVFVNTRSVDIFNGDLYCLASATGANGLIKFTGLPTTDQGAVANMLTGFTSVNTTDFSVDPTGTVVYLTVGGSVEKWQFSGVSWGNPYVLALPSAARYLTVDYSGASPMIYVDTADGQLFKIEDTGAGSTATTLATAGPNQLFKGIRFGPVASAAARPALALARDGGNVILQWDGAFILQFATNVAGPYSDVTAATSPYTNSAVSPPQQFFRLRN